MAQPKTKKPRLVDTARYGSELATFKINKPRQFKRLQKVARRRGVTVAALVSGAPPALQELSTRGIRRQARNIVRSAYKPERAALNRREKANAALGVKQAQDEAAYRMWLDGQVSQLRAQAGAATAAYEKTNARIKDDLTTSQAAVTADLAQRLAEAKVNADPTQSTALAAVPVAQQQAQKQLSASQEHSAALHKIGTTSTETANAALIATAAVRGALNQADQSKRTGELASARTDLGLRQAADEQDLRMQLKARNAELAKGNREYGLAAAQLNIKQADQRLDLKKIRADAAEAKREFKFKVWQEKNKVINERLKREIEYDKIAAQNGRAAADRALRERAQAWDEAHPGKSRNAPGSGGASAGERSASRQTYSDIQTAKTLLATKLATGMSERQARLEMIRNKGASDVVVDVALDLLKHKGKLSRAGVRKARAAGVLRPLKLWELYQYTPSGPGSDAAQG